MGVMPVPGAAWCHPHSADLAAFPTRPTFSFSPPPWTVTCAHCTTWTCCTATRKERSHPGTLRGTGNLTRAIIIVCPTSLPSAVVPSCNVCSLTLCSLPSLAASCVLRACLGRAGRAVAGAGEAPRVLRALVFLADDETTGGGDVGVDAREERRGPAEDMMVHAGRGGDGNSKVKRTKSTCIHAVEIGFMSKRALTWIHRHRRLYWITLHFNICPQPSREPRSN